MKNGGWEGGCIGNNISNKDFYLVQLAFVRIGEPLLPAISIAGSKFCLACFVPGMWNDARSKGENIIWFENERGGRGRGTGIEKAPPQSIDNGSSGGFLFLRRQGKGLLPKLRVGKDK